MNSSTTYHNHLTPTVSSSLLALKFNNHSSLIFFFIFTFIEISHSLFLIIKSPSLKQCCLLNLKNISIYSKKELIWPKRGKRWWTNVRINAIRDNLINLKKKEYTMKLCKKDVLIVLNPPCSLLLHWISISWINEFISKPTTLTNQPWSIQIHMARKVTSRETQTDLVAKLIWEIYSSA